MQYLSHEIPYAAFVRENAGTTQFLSSRRCAYTFKHSAVLSAHGTDNIIKFPLLPLIQFKQMMNSSRPRGLRQNRRVSPYSCFRRGGTTDPYVPQSISTPIAPLDFSTSLHRLVRSNNHRTLVNSLTRRNAIAFMNERCNEELDSEIYRSWHTTVAQAIQRDQMSIQ